MEAPDPNPIPEVHLFPRLEAVGHFIAGIFRFLPANAPDYMSNHYHGNTGGGPALDRALYPEPGSVPDIEGRDL